MTDIVVQSFLMYGLTIVVAGITAVMIRGVVVGLERLNKPKAAAVAAPAEAKAVPAPAAPAEDTDAHVAAIGAAVYAMLGDVRIVYIGESERSPSWTVTGRSLHQTSHNLKRR